MAKWPGVSWRNRNQAWRNAAWRRKPAWRRNALASWRQPPISVAASVMAALNGIAENIKWQRRKQRISVMAAAALSKRISEKWRRKISVAYRNGGG